MSKDFTKDYCLSSTRVQTDHEDGAAEAVSAAGGEQGEQDREHHDGQPQGEAADPALTQLLLALVNSNKLQLALSQLSQLQLQLALVKSPSTRAGTRRHFRSGAAQATLTPAGCTRPRISKTNKALNNISSI